MSYCVGLTGGIGCGKSTVASLFAELGIPVIDTDAISHQLTQPGGVAMAAIQTAFGKEYIDANGALDRAKMRRLVFSDPTAKLRLEKILHPLILYQSKSLEASSTAPYVLLVVPLLFESKSYQDWLDRTVTIDCSEENQIARATQRDGMNEQVIKAIMSKQLPRSLRLKLTDDIIHNDASLSELHPQVAELHRHFLIFAQSNN